ncbi:MAG: sugar phosphate isomerase/epimerase family protein [Sphaerochaetaceae bacterium]
MNKIGIHYGSFISNWMDDQLPLIRKVKELGFDLLEFGSDYLLSQDDEGLKRLRDEAEEVGVDLTISLGLTPAQDIASPVAAERKAGKDILKRVSVAMAKTGISDVSGILYCAWNGKISSYDEKPSRWKYSVESMKEVAKVFEDNGVFVNVEVANRFENYLINTCDEALAYVSDVGSDHVGIHLDTFHMNIEEESFVTPILKAVPKMRYFHIGENNRKMPGLGMLPWKTIFDTLKIAGYTRPISMEPFVRPGGEVGSAISLYRDMMDLSDYENDLRQSLAFVRSMLK